MSKLRYFVLTMPQRTFLRNIALEAYLNHPKDQDAAIELAEELLQQRRKTHGGIISVILIGVALQLVIDLIAYWIKNIVMTPSATYQEDEPGAIDD